MPAGHSPNYWRQNYANVPSEAFANITADMVQNPKSIQRLKEIFPGTVAIYEEMLPELKKRRV